MFIRAVERSAGLVDFTIDGRPAQARAGDSILTAMLTNGDLVRRNEFDGAPRAGFCLMGACQDCWVWLEGAERARACTTPAAPGMQISTLPPAVPVAEDA